MSKAIGYGRVRLDEQGLETVAVAHERAKIRTYAESRGLDLVAVIDDGLPLTAALDRPGLQQVLARVSAGEVGAIIVYRLEHLSRKAADILTVLEQLEACGAHFHAVHEQVDTSAEHGRTFLTVTAAFAQMERDTIAERTVSALAFKKIQGEHVGRSPYGYRINGAKLDKVQEQADAIDLIKSLRLQGLTLRALADELNRRGIITQRGGKWAPQTVKNILDREPG